MKTNYLSSAKAALILLAVFISLVSCQKEDSPPPCTISISNLSGTYKIVSLKYKASASAPEEDYLVFFDACERDDQVRFNSNRTYDYIDAGTACSPPGSDQGTWNLIGNKVESDGLIQGTIQSFDCRTLVVFLTDVYSAGDKLVFTFQK